MRAHVTARIEGVLGRVGPGVKVRGMFVYEHQVRAALSTCGLKAGRLVVGRVDSQDTLTLEIPMRLGEEQQSELLGALRDEIKLSAQLAISPGVDLAGPVLVDARDIWQA